MAGLTIIDWGDGSTPEAGPEHGRVPHRFPSPGTYTVTVCDAARPQLCASAVMTVPPARFTLTAQPDPADEALFHFTALNTPTPSALVAFDFGDGTTATTTATGGTATITHRYVRPLEPGAPMSKTYTVTATSGNESDSVDVIVPDAAPVVRIELDPTDTTGMTAKLTVVSNIGGGPVTVDWGDSTQIIDPVTVGQTISHKYAAANTYTVTTTSKADPDAVDKTSVTVPFNIPLKITARQDPTDPALYHFSIVGADEATTTVDFGDGTSPATVQTPAGTGTVDHTYTRTRS